MFIFLIHIFLSFNLNKKMKPKNKEILDLNNNPQVNNESFINLIQKSDVSNIKTLILSNTGITKLPPKNLIENFVNLENLDITNVQLSDDFFEVAHQLQYFKKLISLSINISCEEEGKVILYSLPLLQQLNGVSVSLEDFRSDFKDEIVNIGKYIQVIITFIDHDIVFLNNFNDSLTSLINNCVNSINEANEGTYGYLIELFNSKYKVFDFLLRVLFDICLENNLSETQKDNLRTVIEDIQYNIDYNHKMLFNISNSANQIYNNVMMKQTENQNNFIGGLNEEINKKQHSINFISSENKRLKDENTILYEGMNNVKEQNQVMMKKLLQHTDNLIRGGSPIHFKTTPNLYKGISSFESLNSSKAKIGNVQNKALSIQTLLETINEIYKSKKNQENKNSSLPNETMEQHLYRYLNNKFGVKQIVIEKAMNIIESLEKYSSENSEVCLFTKIMRNEIDEGSIEINNQLKKNLGKITKNKEINENLINQIVDSLYLNNKKDKESFNKRLKEEKLKTGNNITFNNLHNIILGIHIDDRCRYLSKFKKLFLKYDPENKGVIKKEECIELLSDIHDSLRNNKDFKYKTIKKEDFGLKIYNDIDKNKSGTVTFNQMATYLSDLSHNLMNLITRLL